MAIYNIYSNYQTEHPSYRHICPQGGRWLYPWRSGSRWSFYSSDFTTYPQKIFQLFYNKARRSVIWKCGPRYFIIDCDYSFPFRFFFNPFIPNPPSGFFSGKGEKRTASFSSRLQNKKGRRTAWSQVNSHLTHSTLSSISIEQRPLNARASRHFVFRFCTGFPFGFLTEDKHPED